MAASLGRPWNIMEQVVEDPTTKLRIEFTSVHSEAVKEGQPAPGHDKILYMRLWTSNRDRVATYAFTRGGQFIKTAVEHVDPNVGQGMPAALDAGIENAKIGDRVHAIMAADAGLEAAQQARFAPKNSGPPQPPAQPAGFGDINYADQFVGDM